MSTYTFTVRATDNAGAFSDRTFSLNVNDTVTTTQYDRFVVLGTTGIGRSVDGSTWVVDHLVTSNTNYSGATYGNGKWVYWNGSTLRVADTGLNWTNSYTPVLNGRTSGYNNLSAITCVKYVNNTWRMFVMNQGASYIPDEYTSSDLINWSFQRNIQNNISNLNDSGGAYDFDYDPINDTWVALYTVANSNMYAYYRTGNNAWAAISTAQGYAIGSANQSNTSFVKCTNGFWTLSTGVADSVYTSQDGVNWTARTPIGYSTTPFAMTYQNGRILAFPIPYQTATTTPYGVRESRDGGRTWTARGAEATTGYPLRGFTRANPARFTTASYAGTTVAVTPTTNTIVVSTDEFATFNTVTLSGLGQPLTVQTRDS